MKKSIKNVLLSLSTLAVTAAPIAGVVSCGSSSSSSVDLKTTILVMSPEKKEGEVVSYPMDAIWDAAFKQLKASHPESANFKLHKIHASYDSYEKLATVGITGQSMPDVWFFPSDKMYLLHDQNDAIAEVTDSLKDAVAAKSGVAKSNLLFETAGAKNFGLRFKTETVNMWMNLNELDAIYTKAIDFLNDCALGTTDTGNKTYTPVADNTRLAFPTSVLAVGDKTPSQFVHDVLEANKASFDDKHNYVAKFMSSQLDVAKMGEAMKLAAAKDAKHKIIAVQGENGWPLNALVYANGVGSVEQGLVWEQENKTTHVKNPTSRFMQMKEAGGMKDAMTAWFNMAKYNEATKGPWNNFAEGLQAFTIEGTWYEKNAIDGLKAVYAKDQNANNDVTANYLYSFPLAQVKGHQMRHYSQGWNFGVNRRNGGLAAKRTATEQLIAEMFTPAMQTMFYTNQEHFVPGNMLESDANAMITGDQYVKSTLDFITDATEGAKLGVSRSNIPMYYNTVETKLDDKGKVIETESWDTLYANVISTLKKDKSATVNETSYDTWADKVVNYLTSKRFVKPV